MQRIGLGFLVLGVNDQHLGTVVALNGCCFSVALTEGRQRIGITQEGIFNVSDGRVSLICMLAEVERYRCRSHPD